MRERPSTVAMPGPGVARTGRAPTQPRSRLQPKWLRMRGEEEEQEPEQAIPRSGSRITGHE
eukprot:6853462-Pyramimonas_sp.AAC.1